MPYRKPCGAFPVPMPGAGKPRFLRPGAAATALSLPPATTIFPQLFNGDGPDRALLREGWRRLLPQAIADPLNPQSWKGGRGHAVSALELPDAPEQPGWALRDEPYPPPLCIEWHSQRLATAAGYGFTPPATRSRRAPAGDPAGWPVLGRKHAGMGAAGGLTREKRLPPAVYLLIDAIDNRTGPRSCPAMPISGWRCRKSCCRWFTGWRLSATAPIARWWRAELWRPGDVRRAQLAAALWLRAQPVRLYWWPHRGGAQTGC
jgi:enterochelin esterase family protein